MYKIVLVDQHVDEASKPAIYFLYVLTTTVYPINLFQCPNVELAATFIISSMCTLASLP